MASKAERTTSASWALSAIGAALLMLAGAFPAAGSEALGELELGLRLIEVAPVGIRSGPAAAGIARVEVVLAASSPTKEIRVRVVRPDGTPWVSSGRPLDLGRTAWTRAGTVEPSMEGGGELPPLGAKDAIRAVLEVPLEEAAVHEIVVEAAGEGNSGPVRTENMIRVAWNVPPPGPQDDGTYATFELKVRP